MADQPPRSVGIAAALAYVEAGVLLVAGLVLLLVSSAISEVLDVNLALVALLAVVPIALGAVFIRGARQARAGTGRTLLLWLSAIIAVLHAVNVVNLVAGAGAGAAIVLAVIFLAIPAAIVWQLLRPETVQWLRTSRG